jgi:hypothetical protein
MQRIVHSAYFTDARRPALIEAWYAVMKCIRPVELRVRSIGLAGTGEVYAEWLAEISGSEVRDRMTKSIEILTESMFRRLRGLGRRMFYKNNVRLHLLMISVNPGEA